MRHSYKTNCNSVETINYILETQEKPYRIKLVREYGKTTVVETYTDGTWRNSRFHGTSSEVYTYLWGYFDAIIQAFK